MSVRTCQLCGKPLGRIRVGAGDFCSREHRNQFRLRRSMDHLLEANKVASLMRRRENPKQIPLAQLLVSSAMEPRAGVQNGSFPAGQVQFDFRPLRPVLIDINLAGAGGYVALARLGSAPAAHPVDDPAALPFTQHRSSRAAIPSRRTSQSSVCLPRASLAPIPCQLPGPGIAYRECEAVLRLTRKAVFEFKQLRTEAPGSAYVEKKRHPRLTPQLLDIPAQELASAAPPPERRNPAIRPFRCASRTRPELPLAGSLSYDLLSIAIFSDPRSCDGPQPEQAARIRPLRVPPPIDARPPQNPLPLAPAGGDATAQEAQVCEPDWKTERRAPSHRLRPTVASATDFATRPPLRFAGVFQVQAAAYQVAEVPFAPPDSAFEYRPIALHGTLAAFVAEAPPPPAALEDDFNSGLSRWIGDTAAWKLDVAGARPGGLALLEPSLGWTDYDFEFLTRIGKRGVTFVVRATDIHNYHRITIAPAESGGYELHCAVVIAGNEQPADTTPAGKQARAGSAITVKARVQGTEFTISIDGEVVARGTEERLPAGGIGFTSLPGEQARVYWARLTPLAGLISEAAPGRPRSIS